MASFLRRVLKASIVVHRCRRHLRQLVVSELARRSSALSLSEDLDAGAAWHFGESIQGGPDTVPHDHMVRRGYSGAFPGGSWPTSGSVVHAGTFLACVFPATWGGQLIVAFASNCSNQKETAMLS